MKSILIPIFVMFLCSCSGSKNKYSCDTDTPIPKIDESGSVGQLGGLLYTDSVVIHVEHWPTVVGQKIYFISNTGERIQRYIVHKEFVKYDVNLLFLDKPLDLNKHFKYDIIKPNKSEIFALRLNRPTTTFCVHKIQKGAILGAAKYSKGQRHMEGGTDQIRSGDSGKAWFQYRDGKLGVVGLSSKGNGGVAYTLYELTDKIDKLIEGIDQLESYTK